MRVNDGRRSVNDRRRSVMMGGMKNVMMGGRKNVKIGRTSMGVPRSKCGGWKENMYVREGGVMEHERGFIDGILYRRKEGWKEKCSILHVLHSVHVQCSCTKVMHMYIVHCSCAMCMFTFCTCSCTYLFLLFVGVHVCAPAANYTIKDKIR